MCALHEDTTNLDLKNSSRVDKSAVIYFDQDTIGSQ